VCFFPSCGTEGDFAALAELPYGAIVITDQASFASSPEEAGQGQSLVLGLHPRLAKMVRVIAAATAATSGHTSQPSVAVAAHAGGLATLVVNSRVIVASRHSPRETLALVHDVALTSPTHPILAAWIDTADCGDFAVLHGDVVGAHCATSGAAVLASAAHLRHAWQPAGLLMHDAASSTTEVPAAGALAVPPSMPLAGVQYYSDQLHRAAHPLNAVLRRGSVGTGVAQGSTFEDHNAATGSRGGSIIWRGLVVTPVRLDAPGGIARLRLSKHMPSVYALGRVGSAPAPGVRVILASVDVESDVLHRFAVGARSSAVAGTDEATSSGIVANVTTPYDLSAVPQAKLARVDGDKLESFAVGLGRSADVTDRVLSVLRTCHAARWQVGFAVGFDWGGPDRHAIDAILKTAARWGYEHPSILVLCHSSPFARDEVRTTANGESAVHYTSLEAALTAKPPH
jgi:hypothetical protein